MSEEEMKATVEMKDMLKAENTKLKHENEILKAKIDILTGKAIIVKEKGAKEIKVTKIKGTNDAVERTIELQQEKKDEVKE